MNAPPSHRLSVAATAAVAVVGAAAFFMGFYVLPEGAGPAPLWQRICRAAGIVAPAAGGTSRQAARAGFTSVVVPHAAMAVGTPEQSGHGATLALRCTACHGAQGVSGADAPNLAGQYSEVIYKQLLDFQRGARIDAVMGAMAAPLTDSQMLDLSHYYAQLPRSTAEQSSETAPALVRVGDPMRNIAPCASCHGRTDGKVGAPALDGEPRAYLDLQLTAFATGARKNDANAIMRNEARHLSTSEISVVTDYYAHARL